MAAKLFDRARPFYPLVMSYIASLHGLLELLARGTRGMLDKKLPPGHKEAFFEGLDEKTRMRVRGLLEGSFTPMLGELQLKCIYGGEPVKPDLSEFASDLTENHGYLLESGIAKTSAYATLVLAYELVKQSRTKDPIWEFFRHVRNAAAHGGRFNFQGAEPSRPASWRSAVVERSLQGTPLIRGAAGTPGFLWLGDPIVLLWDVEQVLGATPPKS